MAYLNKVQLIGNLGKDPEIRVNQASGKKVVSTQGRFLTTAPSGPGLPFYAVFCNPVIGVWKSWSDLRE